MSTTATKPPKRGAEATTGTIIDCDAHILPQEADVRPFLSKRWQRHLDTFGLRSVTEMGLIRARWYATREDTWPPSGRPPANDPDFWMEDLIERWGIDMAVINTLAMANQSYVGGNQPREFTAALLGAANDWCTEEFLSRYDGLYSSIAVPFEDPDLAVKEIERLGGSDRWVQVLLPFRTRQPIGRGEYWPIFEAATHYRLPIAFHPGSVGNNLVTGSGWPSYYFEDHCGLPQALYNQIASLICEGVFDRFPSLKIVFQEGGWSWIAPYAWRFDRAWRQLRDEVSHLKLKPSEYLASHFWFTTQPMEEPENPEYFLRALQRFDITDKLMFSSDYPHWDFDSPTSALPKSLPPDLRDKIMSGNAEELYGIAKKGEGK